MSVIEFLLVISYDITISSGSARRLEHRVAGAAGEDSGAAAPALRAS
jgi:hypothetical protein